jgi:NADH-quinone oxidoreductase subunit M
VREFYALLLLAEAAMIGVFVALDLLVFFISSQIALASLYLLTVGWGSRSHAPRLALGWIVIGVLMAAGMLALYFAEPGGAAHSSDITLLHTRAASPALQSSVFLLFLLAFGATMGVFPLHRWTVAAVTAAPTPVAVFVAALLTKLGAYGIFRLLLPLAPDACRRVAPLVAWIALAGMIALALVAWRQRDLRRMIAYANASQMSVMLLGLFALTPAGIGISLTQQIGHAFWITGWLVCASVLSERTGDSGVLAVGGLHKRTPILAGLFAIVVAAATGVFGFLGFIDEASGLRGSQGGQRWGLVAVTGLFVSLLYVIPLVRRMFATAPAPALTLDPRLSGRQLAMLVPVAAFAVIAGVYPDPVLRRVETSVGRVVARIHPEMTPYLRLGADCPTAAPPDPAGPPPGFILVQPCAEGEPAAPKL